MSHGFVVFGGFTKVALVRTLGLICAAECAKPAPPGVPPPFQAPFPCPRVADPPHCVLWVAELIVERARSFGAPVSQSVVLEVCPGAPPCVSCLGAPGPPHDDALPLGNHPRAGAPK